MKRKLWIIAGCLALCLMGCGQQELTYAETCWEQISYTTKLNDYLVENAWRLDVEALQSEADNAESTLSQQFQTAALLSAVEYRQESEDYPISSSYADAVLTKVLTDEENFWKALEEVRCFEIFLPPMLSASKELDGELLVKLMESIPEDSSHKYSVQQELEGWIEENPEKMLTIGDGLIASGYFDGWISSNWNTMFFYDEAYAGSIDDALEYIVYLRDTILPMAQAGDNPALYVGPSEVTGEDYINTTMMVDIGEELTLQEPGDEDSSEEIVTEGKKLVALYRNPHGEEFPGSPAPLRLIGDFMLNLSSQECPASIEEADYYLVLTPTYIYGDYYYYDNGEASDIMQIFSVTSVDLYEAGTGRFLRHLGNVIEDPARGIVSNGSDNAPRYPEEVKADILYYIYSHVNEPDAYAALVDHIGDKTEFERDETFLIGQWEVTYHTSGVTDAYETQLTQYTAGEGNQFITTEFTLTNRGNQKGVFLSSSFDGWEDVIIYIIDFANNTYYDCINLDITNFGLFGRDTLEPGESLTGELVFEVPEGALQEEDSLYIAVSKGWQLLICPLDE
ncbi:MAG: DUF4352 domain-containing protein [Acetatifactor sp.]|nr:DUF4352 domain-containing protein [Acetatifactor sp.]